MCKILLFQERPEDFKYRFTSKVVNCHLIGKKQPVQFENDNDNEIWQWFLMMMPIFYPGYEYKIESHDNNHSLIKDSTYTYNQPLELTVHPVHILKSNFLLIFVWITEAL